MARFSKFLCLLAICFLAVISTCDGKSRKRRRVARQDSLPPIEQPPAMEVAIVDRTTGEWRSIVDYHRRVTRRDRERIRQLEGHIGYEQGRVARARSDRDV